jgi:hypothetical protein
MILKGQKHLLWKLPWRRGESGSLSPGGVRTPNSTLSVLWHSVGKDNVARQRWWIIFISTLTSLTVFEWGWVTPLQVKVEMEALPLTFLMQVMSPPTNFIVSIWSRAVIFLKHLCLSICLFLFPNNSSLFWKFYCLQLLAFPDLWILQQVLWDKTKKRKIQATHCHVTSQTWSPRWAVWFIAFQNILVCFLYKMAWHFSRKISSPSFH